jgi:uncharacterized cupredoxin-like copper-binding protein
VLVEAPVMGFGALWLIVLVVIFAAVVVLVLALGLGGRGGTDADRAQAILRERLAAGEIDERAYQERRDVLTRDGGHGAGRTDRRTAVAIVAAAVVVIGALLLLVAVMSGWWWPMGDHPSAPMHHMSDQRTDAGTAPAPITDAPEITVEAGEMWFEPATIQMTAGEPTNLTLANAGEVLHDLTIEELDLMIEAEPGQRGTAGLELPEAGDYDFYCSVAGHASAGMRGTLTVADSGT